MRAILHVAAWLLVLSPLPTRAQGDAYPSRPITLVVGYPPGGSTDLTGRIVAAELAAALKATVIVENVTGAGGAVAAQRVAKAAPDGYTLMVASSNELIVNRYIKKDIKYDGLKDFTHVGMIASQPLVLVATAKAGVHNTNEFIETVRRSPGKFSYGSAGVGTSLHLLGELVKDKAHLDLVHVPYRGAGPLTNDLLGGQIEYGVFVLSSGLPHIQAGTVVPIGISEQQRSPIAPDIPALAEHPSMKGIDLGVWFVLTAPPGLPQPVLERLRGALAGVLKSPQMRQKLQAAGSTVVKEQPDLQKFMAAEWAKFRRLVDIAGIKPE